MWKILSVLLALTAVANALKCWECYNAKTNYECNRDGQLTTCQYNEDACETHVRPGSTRSEILIYKQCKQAHACYNNQDQNLRDAYFPTQCNFNVRNTVCRCCCSADACNENALSCFNRIEKAMCNGKPLKIDLVIVVDSSSSVDSREWRKQMGLVTQVISHFIIGSYAARVGVFRFNKDVDKASEVKLRSFNNVHDLIHKVSQIPHNGRGTKTGKALTYAFNNAFSSRSGNRPDVPDACLVITDGKSYDSVKEISDLMRISGIEMHAIGVGSQKGMYKTIIAIAEGNAVLYEGGFTSIIGAAQKFASSITSTNCPVEDEPEVTCQTLGPPSNGRNDCGDISNVGDQCNFTCDPGFVLEGSSSSECIDDGDGDANGIWSKPLPTCRETDPCPELHQFKYGSMVCDHGVLGGSTCNLACDEGFAPSDPNAITTTCRADGTWSNPAYPCCLPETCPPLPPVDVALIIDSSSSINAEEWILQMDFVKKLVGMFDVGSDASRIGVVRFNKKVDTETEIKLRDTTDAENLIRLIDLIPHDGSGTNTGKALVYATENSLSAAFGNRPETEDIVIVITDGFSYDDVVGPANHLRTSGAKIFAVGIGIDKPRGLVTIDEIAGNRSEEFVYMVDDFSALDASLVGVFDAVARMVCDHCPL